MKNELVQMKIKAILFDLDGVLINSNDWHYDALNESLIQNGFKPIERKEHLTTFDGLTTRTKLSMRKDIPSSMHDKIYMDKKKIAMKYIKERTEPIDIHINTLQKLKSEGYKLAVCSNANRHSVETMLTKANIIHYFDFCISNQDVKNPKPNPEIYLNAVKKYGLSRDECMAIEDNMKGFKSVENAGIKLMKVKTVNDVTYENIKENIRRSENMINVVIPMAGEGMRFKEKGFKEPKPFIDVNGKPMIQQAIDSLNISEGERRLILLVNDAHLDEYRAYFDSFAEKYSNTIIIPVSRTEGATCTVLHSHYHINNSDPLLIVNCDQLLFSNINDMIRDAKRRELDGSIITFSEDESSKKWSYVSLSNELVTAVREKVPISNIATIGIYYFKHGSDFVNSAMDMLIANERVNNEFYVCPVYNYLIRRGANIGIFMVRDDEWASLGTPELLAKFLRR